MGMRCRGGISFWTLDAVWRVLSRPQARLFRRGAAEFEARPVHETLHFVGKAGRLRATWCTTPIPRLEAYIAHMDRYSTLGAEQAVSGEGKRHCRRSPSMWS